jgi:cell division protein FtsA
MKNELVAVLDLGSTKAVCMVARRSATGNVEPVALSTVPVHGMRRGKIEDSDALAVGIAEAVRKVETAIGQALGSVTVSVSGSGYEASHAQGFVEIIPHGRKVNSDDVLRVVNHSRQTLTPADREQVMALPREFKVNGERGFATPIGMPASRLEVTTYLLTGLTADIQTLERTLTSAGGVLNGMAVGALTSGLGVLTQEDMNRGVAVVDIGAWQTTVAVFEGGAIAAHGFVPIGSQHVTNDVAVLLRTSRDEAERLKLRYGAATSKVVNEMDEMEVVQEGMDGPRPMSRKVFCELIESRTREIANLASDRIIKTGYLPDLRGGVVLTGGGSQLQAFDEVFEDELGKVRIRRLSPKTEGQIRTAVNRPEMASAVGLARFALDREDEELSSADGSGNWRDRIRSLRGRFGGK